MRLQRRNQAKKRHLVDAHPRLQMVLEEKSHFFLGEPWVIVYRAQETRKVFSSQLQENLAQRMAFSLRKDGCEFFHTPCAVAPTIFSSTTLPNIWPMIRLGPCFLSETKVSSREESKKKNTFRQFALNLRRRQQRCSWCNSQRFPLMSRLFWLTFDRSIAR